MKILNKRSTADFTVGNIYNLTNTSQGTAFLLLTCKTLKKEGRAFRNIGQIIYIPDCKISLASFVLHIKYIFFYYIDTGVLLENIPLVKFIKTTSGT